MPRIGQLTEFKKCNLIDKPWSSDNHFKICDQFSEIKTQTWTTINAQLWIVKSYLKSREDRCNRNEKFFSESLILGTQGLRYLNDMHKKYCYSVSRHSHRNVYDVLQLDDSARILYL
jgi:hypothetical protein